MQANLDRLTTYVRYWFWLVVSVSKNKYKLKNYIKENGIFTVIINMYISDQDQCLSNIAANTIYIIINLSMKVT